MGYVTHHAVITVVPAHRVDDVDDSRLLKGLQQLRDATGGCAMDLLLGPADGLVNGSITYVLTPDGSKEGWDTAALGDRARALFVEFFTAAGADVIEVTFGEDYQQERGATVIAHHGAFDE